MKHYFLISILAILFTNCAAQRNKYHTTTQEHGSRENLETWYGTMDTLEIGWIDGVAFYLGNDTYWILEEFQAHGGATVIKLESANAGDVAVINADKSECTVTIGHESTTYFLRPGPVPPKLQNAVPKGTAKFAKY